MKKIIFVIVVVFAIINIQNLYAQKKYALLSGNKSVEIIGEYVYEDPDTFNKYYVSIEKDKIVLWEYSDASLSKESIDFDDIDTGTNSISIVEGLSLENEKFYSAFFRCKNAKCCKIIFYVNGKEDEPDIDTFSNQLKVKFKTRKEAEAFMAKVKKTMKK